MCTHNQLTSRISDLVKIFTNKFIIVAWYIFGGELVTLLLHDNLIKFFIKYHYSDHESFAGLS